MLHQFERSRSPTPEIKPVDKRLKLYNQYPGNYPGGITDMTGDLERIANMGFKQVWVNPLFVPCQSNFIDDDKTHCPYAMYDEDAFNPAFVRSEEEVVNYTKEARKLGLSPLFDLVAHHVSIDHPLVNGTHALSELYDTSIWFKRHPNGNLKVKGLTDEYGPTDSKNPWSDVAIFDYEDPTIRQQIIDHFWKPFLKYNIETLGFTGARLDAVGRIPRDVHEQLLGYVKTLCREHHHQDPYLVAETVGAEHMEKDLVIKGLATHTMNSAFWMPGPEGKEGHDYGLWRDDGNWYAHAKGVLQQAGPTAGHSGSHDEKRYPAVLREKGIEDPVVLKQRMLEMIMVAAFGSDGGHILAFGDEFGVERQVDLHHPEPVRRDEFQYDLTPEIKEVNALVSKLPEPTFPEWSQRVFVEEYPELVVFIVHQGEGFTGSSHLIVGNSYNEEDKGIELTPDMLDTIMQANGRNEGPEKTKRPDKVFTCGRVTPHPSLSIPVETFFEPPTSLVRERRIEL